MIELSVVFTSSLLLAKLLNPSEFGQFTLFLKLSVLTSSFFVLGLNRVLINTSSNLKITSQKDRDILSKLFYLTLLITLAISLILWCLSYSIDKPRILIYIALALPPLSILILFSGFFISKGLAWIGNLIKMGGVRILFLILLIAYHYTREVYMEDIFKLFLISIYLIFISLIFFLRKDISKPDWKLVFELKEIKNGFPYVINQTSIILTQQIYLYSLNQFRNSEDIAFFDIAFQIANLTSLAHMMTIPALTSKFSQFYKNQNKEDLELLFNKSSQLLQIIGITLLVFLGIFGYNILGLWGEQYLVSFYPMIIMGFAFMIDASFGAIGEIMKISGQEKKLAKFSSWNLLFSSITATILVYFFGIIGASFSFLMSSIFFNLIKYRATRRIYNVSIPLFFFHSKNF